MNVLTVIQPYASLIMRAEPAERKLCENRGYAPPAAAVGRLLAIHAGKARTYNGQDVEPLAEAFGLRASLLPFGAVLGVARLVADVRIEWDGTIKLVDPLSASRWPWLLRHEHAAGPHAWILSEPLLFQRPLPIRGQQGIWRIDDADVEAALGLPLVACPSCGDVQVDLDGFGVMKCDVCGFCRHPDISSGKCNCCGRAV
jgi:hypothetical protein